MTASAHAKRWITVAFVVPVLIIFFLYAPSIAVTVLAAVVMCMALWEYFHAFCETKKPYDYGYLLACALGATIMFSAWAQSFDLMFVTLWMTLFVFAARAVILYNQGGRSFERLVLEAFSILYIPCLLSAAVLIRVGDRGVAWLFFTLFLAFISDTGAFYGGKFFGKHKLIPKVSPGKTVEGSMGSIVADLIVASVFKLLVFPELSWHFILVLGVTAAVATQMGDLFESMLKRSFGIKDSGVFFPGHGGMLDRIDGFFFTGPVVYCFMLLAAL
ncbi:MAG: phosphatidate cytidylyltransferase [Thermodesulfobacteriota bacterium]